LVPQDGIEHLYFNILSDIILIYITVV